MSATYCKMFNSINILQRCPSDFVTEAASGYTYNTPEIALYIRLILQ